MIEIKIEGMDKKDDSAEKENEGLSEFCLPKSEVNADLAVGEFGNLTIQVEVIAVESDEIKFRRHGEAKADGAFKAESLEQMRERIGVAEDLEEPMQKKKRDKEEETGE